LKASEGIDFADEFARGVLVLGIPFPSIKDTKAR
jgi:Fanconi anemia group J protein